MAVFKLANRNVVVSEGKVTKVLTPPCGVSYSEQEERWNAWVLNEKGNWAGRSFSNRKHGAIRAFELAVEAREESLEALYTRRLLPRIRRAYEIREHSGSFWVRDPIEKKTRRFTSLHFAAKFNLEVIEAWKEMWAFDKETMIKIELNSAKGLSLDQASDSFTREFQRISKELGL